MCITPNQVQMGGEEVQPVDRSSTGIRIQEQIDAAGRAARPSTADGGSCNGEPCGNNESD
ncbi:unnamed protein product [Urochloa humidicola]